MDSELKIRYYIYGGFGEKTEMDSIGTRYDNNERNYSKT